MAGQWSGTRGRVRASERPARPNRSAMRASLWEGVWSNGSENMMAPFIPMYALSLGAGPALIGLVSSIPALVGNLFQIPAARLAERFGHRRLYRLGNAGRLLWLLPGLIPFLHLPTETAVAILIVLLVLRTTMVSMAVPAWTALMAQAVPMRIRGRYFANRNLLACLASLIGSAVAGWLVRLGGFPAGYSALFGLAALAGLFSFINASRMPELSPRVAHAPSSRPQDPESHAPATVSPGAHLSLRDRIRGAARFFGPDQPFSRYVLTSFLWTFSVNLPAPLFAVHFKQGLGGDEAIWGLVTASGMAMQMVGQRYWGRRTVTMGDRNIVLVAGIGAACVPLLWSIAPAPGWAFGAEMIGGLAWSGYNLAAFTLLLRLLPPGQQAGPVAFYNTMVGIAQGLGPMVGGVLVGFLGNRGMFVLSGVMRLLALALFARTVSVAGTPALRIKHLRPYRHGRPAVRLKPRRVSLPAVLRRGE